MAIPDFQSVMLPLLKFAGDNQEHSIREAREKLAEVFVLSEEEKNELLASGQQGVFDNRVGWARTYLKKAGLIEYARRGVFKITQRGLDVLSKNLSEINLKFLEQYPEYINFREASKKDKEGIERFESETETTAQQTPEESLEYGYQKIRQNIAQELLTRIKECSPGFFERLVVELLVKMGYGRKLPHQVDSFKVEFSALC
ncbi:MAG: hypothetical protein HZB84_05300 [Deltaproteobacteria bacterium]|nr:hypothetical protein [Deltaproteobacteria bacterium]